MNIKYALLFSFIVTRVAAREHSPLNFSREHLTICVGYGVPSVIRTFIKQKTVMEDIKVYGLGPCILKLNYRINKRFSVGLNSIYNYTKVSGKLLGYDTVTFEKKKYENGVIGNEISATVRGNYHFFIRKNYESYAGLGIGFGYVNARTYSKAPSPPVYTNYDFPSPFRFEATYGFRYFPTKHFGVYSEIGLGKGWILVETYSKYYIPEALVQLGIIIKI